ncbi:MAG: hypothetical protein Q8L98_08745 [Chlamydiales bacterium]|nr:hypothetical protein [Chlamydiales bacterium]
MSTSPIIPSLSSQTYQFPDLSIDSAQTETEEALKCISVYRQSHRMKHNPSSQRLLSDMHNVEKMAKESSVGQFQRETAISFQHLNSASGSFSQDRAIHQIKQEEVRQQAAYLDADLQNLFFSSFEPVNMDEKKAELAQCILTSMDPESPFGTMPCLEHHSKGLSENEEKELSAEVPNMIAGKALTELAVVPAVIAGTVTALASVAIKGLVLGSLAEGLAQGDPANFHERLEEARQALNGENPEFNRAMSELTPESLKSVGRVIQQGVDYAGEIDRYTQENFYTPPGIVQEGMVGAAEIGAAVIGGVVLKNSLRVARSAAQGTSQAYQALKTSISQEGQAVAKGLSDVGKLFEGPSLAYAPAVISNKAPGRGFALERYPVEQDQPFFFNAEGSSSGRDPRKMAIRAKAAAGYADYALGIQKETLWTKHLQNYYPSLDLPKSFPKNLKQFHRECDNLPFRSTKLGELGKGVLEGNLLYKKTEKGVLFVIQRRVESSLIQNKIGTTRLIESVHLKWHERLEHTLKKITDFVQEEKLQQLYLAWDPSKMPVATVLNKQAQPILGVNSLSAGVGQEPFIVVEIALP